MNADTTAPASPLPPPRAPAVPPSRARHGDWLVLLTVVLLVALAWFNTRLGWVGIDDDANYWVAVVGGSMMLALFGYPLRKRLRPMQRLGRVKAWFWGHLVLGIGGPWLILVHSNFHVGSLNAAVALFSMITVVASGVVGRVLYVRVHRGLNGELTTLAQLRERAGLEETAVRSGLRFAPAVEARLVAFEQRALPADAGWRVHLRQVLWLPLEASWVQRRCRTELRRRIDELAAERGWPAEDAARRERAARRLVARFTDAVVRVAHFSAYERLFALWHVAHLPFVVLLVISAVVHVIAVHAY